MSYGYFMSLSLTTVSTAARIFAFLRVMLRLVAESHVLCGTILLELPSQGSVPSDLSLPPMVVHWLADVQPDESQAVVSQAGGSDKSSRGSRPVVADGKVTAVAQTRDSYADVGGG